MPKIRISFFVLNTYKIENVSFRQQSTPGFRMLENVRGGMKKDCLVHNSVSFQAGILYSL